MNDQHTLYGMKVFIEPEIPRYTLPDDVPPPKGMTRQEFATWSLRVCGVRDSIVLKGTILKTPLGFHMNRETWNTLRLTLARKEKAPDL